MEQFVCVESYFRAEIVRRHASPKGSREKSKVGTSSARERRMTQFCVSHSLMALKCDIYVRTMVYTRLEVRQRDRKMSPFQEWNLCEKSATCIIFICLCKRVHSEWCFIVCTRTKNKDFRWHCTCWVNCGKATSVGTVYLQPISIERNQSVRRSAARTHAFIYTNDCMSWDESSFFCCCCHLGGVGGVAETRTRKHSNPQLTLNFSAPGLYIMYTHMT